MSVYAARLARDELADKMANATGEIVTFHALAERYLDALRDGRPAPPMPPH